MKKDKHENSAEKHKANNDDQKRQNEKDKQQTPHSSKQGRKEQEPKEPTKENKLKENKKPTDKNDKQKGPKSENPKNDEQSKQRKKLEQIKASTNEQNGIDKNDGPKGLEKNQHNDKTDEILASTSKNKKVNKKDREKEGLKEKALRRLSDTIQGSTHKYKAKEGKLLPDDKKESKAKITKTKSTEAEDAGIKELKGQKKKQKSIKSEQDFENNQTNTEEFGHMAGSTTLLLKDEITNLRQNKSSRKRKASKKQLKPVSKGKAKKSVQLLEPDDDLSSTSILVDAVNKRQTNDEAAEVVQAVVARIELSRRYRVQHADFQKRKKQFTKKVNVYAARSFRSVVFLAPLIVPCIFAPDWNPVQHLNASRILVVDEIGPWTTCSCQKDTWLDLKLIKFCIESPMKRRCTYTVYAITHSKHPVYMSATSAGCLVIAWLIALAVMIKARCQVGKDFAVTEVQIVVYILATFLAVFLATLTVFHWCLEDYIIGIKETCCGYSPIIFSLGILIIGTRALKLCVMAYRISLWDLQKSDLSIGRKHHRARNIKSYNPYDAERAQREFLNQLKKNNRSVLQDLVG